MATQASQISVVAELERCGWGFEWSGSDELKCRCPFHDDASPSCCVNVDKRVFKCFVCKAHGDIVGLLAAILKAPRAVVLLDLGKRYVLDEKKIIDPHTIERYHQAIWSAGPLLKELERRAVSHDMVRKYRLGAYEGRVTIPIKNESGLYVNVRRYLPGAPGADKFRNARGRGKIRLFPHEQLRYDDVLLCGGEIKAIVAAEELNPHAVGAICATGGEENWDPRLTREFQGKRVWVCMDVDEVGRRASQELCGILSRAARWIGEVVLPLDVDQHPHGDINDYVAAGGRLWPLLEAAAEYQRPGKSSAGDDTVDATPENTDLVSAMSATSVGRRLRVKVVVSSMDTAPYIVPHRVIPRCDRSQKECAICPVYSSEDNQEHEVAPESSAILAMVKARSHVLRESIMAALDVPRTCPAVDFDVTAHYNVEETRVSPQLDITERGVDRPMQPAYCVGESPELNASYYVTGRVHPHPLTQQSTLVVSRCEPAADALSTYEPHHLERLLMFQPDEWTRESVRSKLHKLYADLEANVTRICQRREIHLVVDMAYHSPLLIDLDDSPNTKGWVEVLIMGDSSQGKSETTMRMMRHYEVGAKVECKNATNAGLLGGVQKFGDRWFATWGVIPTHDKRLLVLEELKGMATEEIGKLTDMRSSGIAEMQKIEKRRTFARTRLIALSNTRGEGVRPLSSYNFGVEAVQELIGGLEDVRRFDTCLLVGADDVDAKALDAWVRERAPVPHRHTSELCHELVLWAWTRRESEVWFEPEAKTVILDEALSMSEEFTEQIPIVDRGSMRYKLARLAAAIAARTFSCDETMQALVVRPCHAEFVAEFLKRQYRRPIVGYTDYTAAIRLTQTITDEPAVIKAINATPFARDLCKNLLNTSDIELQDVQDWCAWDRYDAQQLLSVFVRKQALLRVARGYRKTPPFIKLLRTLLENGKLVDRPSYMEETEEF